MDVCAEEINHGGESYVMFLLCFAYTLFKVAIDIRLHWHFIKVFPLS